MIDIIINKNPKEMFKMILELDLEGQQSLTQRYVILTEALIKADSALQPNKLFETMKLRSAERFWQAVSIGLLQIACKVLRTRHAQSRSGEVSRE